MESFIDGSTKWRNGASVICDNDATYSGHVAYVVIDEPERGTIVENAISYLRGYDGGPYKCQEPERTCKWLKEKYSDYTQYQQHTEL